MSKTIVRLAVAIFCLCLTSGQLNYAEEPANKEGAALCDGSLYLCDPCAPHCQPYLDPCCYDPCCFGSFAISADLIVWRLCVGDLDYAALVRDETIDDVSSMGHFRVRYKHINRGWEPGFRIRFSKPDLCRGWTFLASYSYITANTHSSINAESPDFLVSPLLHPYINANTNGRYAQIKGRHMLQYQGWDALLGYPCLCGSGLLWTPFVGLDGFHINEKLKTALNNPSTIHGGFFGHTGLRAEYDAVGLKAGHDLELRFCSCLKFFSRASMSLAAVGPVVKHRQLITNNAENDGEQVNAHDSLCCQLYPGYHLQVGLAYETCYGNIDYMVRLGYEVLEWLNLPSSRRFGNEHEASIALSSTYDTRHIGFHGFLAGMEVKF